MLISWEKLLLSCAFLGFASVFQSATAQGTIELVIISENISIDAGESALLVCVGFSQYNNSVEIVWQKNGMDVMNTSSSFLSNEDLVHRGRLFTQSFLQLCNVQVEDTGNFTCIVRNGSETVSGMVEINVENVIELALITNDTTVEVGDNALLVCVGYGQPSITITWSKDGRELTNSSNEYITEEDTEIRGRLFRQSFLRICGLQTCHSGAYNCSVNNGISSIESHTNITVEGDSLRIVSISNSSTVSSGAPMQLTCIVQPSNNTDITWTLEGHTISDSTTVSVTEELHESNGKFYKTSILNYKNMQSQDAGKHWCYVTNHCDSTGQFVEVSVSPLSDNPVTPGTSSLLPIIGIAVAAGVVLALIILALLVVICVCICKKKKKEAQKPDLMSSEPDNTYEEIGKGSSYGEYEHVKPKDYDVMYEKPNHYDFESIQKNSAYGMVQTNGQFTTEPVYVETDNF